MKRKISDKQIKSLQEDMVLRFGKQIGDIGTQNLIGSAEELEMLTKIIEYIVGETLKKLDNDTTAMQNRLYRLEKEFFNKVGNKNND